MSDRDYYDVLGVVRGAGESEIKKAYKRLVMKYHPDRNRDNKEAQERLKEVNRAYDVLSDNEKRRIYDHHGHEGLRAAASGGGFGGASPEDLFGDIFGSIFGGGRTSGGSRATPQGRDIQVKLTIDLPEAVAGHTEHFPITAPTNCDDCNGSGVAPGSEPEFCMDCDGTGVMRVAQGFFSMQRTCGRCGGSGKIIRNPCSHCRGSGSVRKKRTLKVDIPAGVDNGDVLTLRGEGEPGGPGGISGDLRILVEVRPHALFTRDGPNLYCDVPVNISELALGGSLRIPTLDGEVSVKLPAGTQSGKRLRLSGKGVPGLRGTRRGDLFCRVMAETPVRLSRRHKELLKELSDLGDDSNCPQHQKWLKSARDFVKQAMSASGR